MWLGLGLKEEKIGHNGMAQSISPSSPSHVMHEPFLTPYIFLFFPLTFSSC